MDLYSFYGAQIQNGVMTGELTIGEMNFDNYSVLAEIAEVGGYIVQIRPGHNTGANIMLNATYGLNAAGSVKDDDASEAWQDVVNDIRFRKPLLTPSLLSNSHNQPWKLYGCHIVHVALSSTIMFLKVGVRVRLLKSIMGR